MPKRRDNAAERIARLDHLMEEYRSIGEELRRETERADPRTACYAMQAKANGKDAGTRKARRKA
jgi:hypothetical protein